MTMERARRPVMTMYLREARSRLIAVDPRFAVRAAAGSRDAMPESAAERVNAEPPALLAPFGAAPPVTAETMPVTADMPVAPLSAAVPAVPAVLTDEEPVDDDTAFVAVATGADTAFVAVATGAEAAFVTVETAAETAFVTVATGAGAGAGGSVGAGTGAGDGGGAGAGAVGTGTGSVTGGTATGEVTVGTGTGDVTVGSGVDDPGRPAASAVPAAPVPPSSATAIAAADLTVL